MPNYFRILWLACALLLLPSCDNRSSKGQPAAVVDTPYSVWLTGRRLSGDELSQALKNNPDYANQLCRHDINRPAGYRQHIALLSTPQLDRKDLAQHYRWDSSKPVRYADSDQLVSNNLGDLLRQQGPILITNEDTAFRIKLTFSEHGVFSGYCDNTNSTGYTPVVGNPIDEKIRQFIARCSEPGGVVCLSIK